MAKKDWHYFTQSDYKDLQSTHDARIIKPNVSIDLTNSMVVL